ncbi:hypothetical protein ETB97_005195 [Aspergillus alliaceus]|uniref:Uncharacterized protein n=1 Tax=Petromyces alliaceus TaxID=209559 RepID=A0A8H6E377_PETAA|nr:hypothetical protein ETB97_005195 [Aspergillus burnettii]
MGSILYSIWAIRLNSRELDLAAEEAIVCVASGRAAETASQSGNAVFKRYYQSQFISRDLQRVVLLRPFQEGLLRVARSMLRKRDSLALSDLTDQQKHAIFRDSKILELRQEQRELKEEIPKAECFDADKLLAQRIQVSKDMVALSKLCEPSQQCNRINWAMSDDTEADELEGE